MGTDVRTGRPAVFWLGLTALLIAAVAHALVWSGGLLALPLAWIFAAVALGIALPRARRAGPLSLRSRLGAAMAALVLVGSVGELIVGALRT